MRTCRSSEEAASCDRRALLRSLGAASALCFTGLAAGGGAALARSSDSRIKTVLSWIPNYQFAGIWVALDRGYFATNGLELDWLPGGPNTPNPVERVASGEVQLGQQANIRPILEAFAKGNDFAIIGSRYQRQPGGLLSLARDPILTPADIVGKRIICPTPTDVRTVEITLALNGLPNDFRYVPGGHTPFALVNDQGDAMVANVANQPITLELQGLAPEEDFFHRSWGALGQPGYYDLLFAQRNWLDTYREDVVRYLRSEIQGWKVAQADPDYAAGLAVRRYGAFFGLDQEHETRALNTLLSYMTSDDTNAHGLFWVDKDRIRGAVYAAMRAGGMENLPVPEQMIDMSFLKEAHESV